MTNTMPTAAREFTRAALRAHVSDELGRPSNSDQVMAEVAARIELAKTSPEQRAANAIVVEAARMMLAGRL